MSDRPSIGQDNPAFRGRLRQPSGLAQSLHVAPKLKAPRPSARYYNHYDNRPLGSPKLSAANPLPVPLQAATSPAPQPKIITPQPIATSPAPTQAAMAIQRSPQQQPAPAKTTQPVFRANWQASAVPAKGKVADIVAVTPQPKPVLSQQVAAAPAETKKLEVAKPAAPILHKTQEQSHVLKRQTLYQTQLQQPELPKGRTAKLRAKLKLPRLSHYSRPQLAMFGMGVMVFMIGLFVSVSTLRTNHAATAQVEALAKTSVEQPATTDSAESGQTSSGSGSSAPSTVRPSTAAVSNYAVGPTLPRYLDIPRFGVHARVLSLGILNSGALATPNNVYDAGWYNMSAKPGEPGAVLMDGHVSSWTSHGVFYNLSKMVAGDQIKITRGDGQVFTYEVVKSQTFDKDNVDMQSAVKPIDPTKPGLNLITCTGQVIRGTSEFNQRILVYTKQI